MSIVNLTLPLSAAPSATPIRIDSFTSPGKLIHVSQQDQDFVWLWVGVDKFMPYTRTLLMQLVKGNTSIGYQLDSVIRVPNDKKQLVENGILLTNGTELRAILLDPKDELQGEVDIPYPVVTGYIHRRIS